MKMYMNLLPCITWKWLRMNGAEAEISPAGRSDIVLPESWGMSSDTKAYGLEVDARSNADIERALFEDKIVTGIGPDLDRAAVENDIPVIRLTAGEDPLVIENRYNDGDKVMTCLEITVPDGVHTTVTEKFYSDEDTGAEAVFQTRFVIGEGASVDFVQVQRLGRNVRFFNDCGSLNEKDGRLDCVSLILAGGETYYGSRANLKGKNSAFTTDMAYIVKGDEKLDVNIAAFQRGKKTNSLITINGTLKDNAKKLVRATIDFKKGSSGSTGEETEDVLMMNDGVVNRTVPLILCTEEDVEGIHGATLGRPSEEIVMYMMSRGLDKNTIYDIMEKARLDACAAKIADEQTRREIQEYLHPEASLD